MSYVETMGRYRDDVRTMIQNGAGESDIEEYLKIRGITQANLRQFAAVEKAHEEAAEKPTKFERFGRGMQDIALGTAQLFGAEAGAQKALTHLPGGIPSGAYSGVDDETLKQREREDVSTYEKNVGPGMDWMRMAGQVTGTAPLMALPASQAGLLARTGMGALAGGMGGASVYAPDIETKLMNTGMGVGMGGAFSAAAPAVVSAAGRAGGVVREASKRAKGLLDSVKMKGTITGELAEAAGREGVPLEQLGPMARKQIMDEARQATQTGLLDPEALARRSRAQSVGFFDDAAPTTGQVTRDPRVFSSEVEVAKQEAGQALSKRFASQRAHANNWLKGMQERVFGQGGESVTPYEAGERVVKSATKKAASMQTRVRAAYESVEDGVTLSKDALHDRTAQLLDDLEGAYKPGVKTRITKLVNDDSKAFTFDEYVKLDKLITDTTGTDAAELRAAAILKKALLGVVDDSEDAVSAGSKQAYLQAKKLASQRFEAIGPRNKLTAKFIQGDVGPEKLVEQIKKSSSIDEVRALLDFVDGDTRKYIRASLLNDIIDRATPSGNYSQAAFNRAINSVQPEKLDLIFAGGSHSGGMNAANKLRMFGKATEDLFGFPAGHTVNTSNTAAQTANMVQRLYKGLIEEIPGGRFATGLLGGAGEKAKQKQTQSIVELALQGGLPKQPGLLSGPNPAAPLLPSVRGASVPIGLLGANQQQ